MDSLLPQLDSICDWIERAHQEGGKVLVHCRVGVSRSATVTVSVLSVHQADTNSASILFLADCVPHETPPAASSRFVPDCAITSIECPHPTKYAPAIQSSWVGST